VVNKLNTWFIKEYHIHFQLIVSHTTNSLILNLRFCYYYCNCMHTNQLTNYNYSSFRYTCSAGIFGNGLSAVVLSRPQMKSSVTCLLLGLAFCDTLLISISILIYGLPYICDYAYNSSILRAYRLVYYPLWVPYLFPICISGKNFFTAWLLTVASL